MWCAAITSVTGSAYTSFSFVSGFSPRIRDHLTILISLFIIVSAIIFVLIGQPVQILVYVGMLNGFILPLALTIMLIAAYQLRKGDYHHPVWLYIFGAIVVIATGWFSIQALLSMR
jgi:Mn2+/Fe2+ NRAMP family transporter